MSASAGATDSDDESAVDAGLPVTLLRGLIIATLFCVFGPLGRLLALGSWYGVPIWLSGGVAIAALLLWGPRYWPAVFLAGFASVYVCMAVLVPEAGWLPVLAASSGVGGVVALQALFGAWLVRRWGRFGADAERLRDMARPALLGAAAVSAGPLAGPPWIAGAGLIPWEAVPGLALRWWAAEALGAALVLALVSLWVSDLRGAPGRTKLAVFAPPALLLVGFVVLFVAALERRQGDLLRRYLHDAEHLAAELVARLEDQVQALGLAEALMASSDEVTRDEYLRFVEAIRETSGIAGTMLWIPCVPRDQLPEFAAAVRAWGGEPGFEVEPAVPPAAGAAGPPGDPEAVYPVQYAALGSEGGTMRPGLELGADPAILATLARARDTGAATLVPPARGDGGSVLDGAAMLVLAHYEGTARPDSPAGRQDALAGFNASVFRVENRLAAVFAHDAELQVVLELHDVEAGGDALLLASAGDPGPGALLPNMAFRGAGWGAPITYRQAFTFANREWVLSVTTTEAFHSGNQPWQEEAMMVGGTLIAFLFAVVLMVLAGRNARAEAVVAARTAALRKEIDERKKSEEARLRVIGDLEQALAAVRTLEGLLPICASCKKIRDDQGYWTQIEAYVSKHSRARFSHGICPDCLERLYPEFIYDEEA